MERSGSIWVARSRGNLAVWQGLGSECFPAAAPFPFAVFISLCISWSCLLSPRCILRSRRVAHSRLSHPHRDPARSCCHSAPVAQLRQRELTGSSWHFPSYHLCSNSEWTVPSWYRELKQGLSIRGIDSFLSGMWHLSASPPGHRRAMAQPQAVGALHLHIPGVSLWGPCHRAKPRERGSLCSPKITQICQAWVVFKRRFSISFPWRAAGSAADVPAPSPARRFQHHAAPVASVWACWFYLTQGTTTREKCIKIGFKRNIFKYK